jgi:hypothetical protein
VETTTDHGTVTTFAGKGGTQEFTADGQNIWDYGAGVTSNLMQGGKPVAGTSIVWTGKITYHYNLNGQSLQLLAAVGQGTFTWIEKGQVTRTGALGDSSVVNSTVMCQGDHLTIHTEQSIADGVTISIIDELTRLAGRP